jgi:hypothetical protein
VHLDIYFIWSMCQKHITCSKSTIIKNQCYMVWTFIYYSSVIVSQGTRISAFENHSSDYPINIKQENHGTLLKLNTMSSSQTFLKEKLNSTHGSICSSHRKIYFEILKNSNKKFRAYVSTFYTRTSSFAKNRHFLWLLWKSQKTSRTQPFLDRNLSWRKHLFNVSTNTVTR